MSAIFTGPMLSERWRTRLRLTWAFVLGMGFAGFAFVSYVAISEFARGGRDDTAALGTAPSDPANTRAETTAQATDERGRPIRTIPITKAPPPAETVSAASRTAGVDQAITSGSEAVPLPRPRPAEAPQVAVRSTPPSVPSAGTAEPPVFSLNSAGGSPGSASTAPVLEGGRQKADRAVTSAQPPEPNATAESPDATEAEQAAQQKSARSRSEARARQRARANREARRRQPVEQEFPPFFSSPYGGYAMPDGRRAQVDRSYPGRRIIPAPPGAIFQ